MVLKAGYYQANSSQIVVEQPTCDAIDQKAVYATTQPPDEPPSASIGVALAGSDSGAAKAMEKSVAKRSIDACQIEMAR